MRPEHGFLLMPPVIGLVVGLHVEIHEATLEAIHLGFTNGSLTSTCFYLDQISRLNPLLRAVIEVNPSPQTAHESPARVVGRPTDGCAARCPRPASSRTTSPPTTRSTQRRAPPSFSSAPW